MGRSPNHPESAMVALLKKFGYKQGKTKKAGIWGKTRRVIKRRLADDSSDFFVNCVWGPFKGGGPYEMDIAFPDSKLDLEIDGAAWHDELKKVKDNARDLVLKNAGWIVIRITDNQVYRIFVPLMNQF